MIMKSLSTAFLIAVAAAAFSMPVFAKEKDLGHFGTWHAYSANEGGQTVCYMTTTKMRLPIAHKRAQPYLMITHRPIEASTDVVSYGAGAILEKRRSPKMLVGQTSFELFSVRDIAWARDALTDHRITQAILRVRSAQISAFLTYKTGEKPINDTFDVMGAADAYRAIGKACGLSMGTPKAPQKGPFKHKGPLRRPK